MLISCQEPSELAGSDVPTPVGDTIAVVAIQEQIDTRDSSAATKFLRRAMMALGAYQVDATSERIRDGQARARGRDAASAGRPP